MNANYELHDLPLAELENLGLYRDGKLLMEPEDEEALLAGRRTELISLHDLKADGFQIEQLDAKLSVVPDWDNKLTLKIHPIYKEAQRHPLLLNTEADMLVNKVMGSISKTYTNQDKSKTYVIEYDEDTKEFISYQPERVIAPDKVNNEKLSEKQKADFRNGAVVTLSDGTRLQYRASDRKGIRSDRAALVLSVLLDGGISYLIIRGLRNLLNSREAQKTEETPGFIQAANESRKKVNPDLDELQQEFTQQSQENLNRAKPRGR